MTRERIQTYWGPVDCVWDKRGILALGTPDHSLPAPRSEISEFGYLLEKELAAYLSGALTHLTLPFVIPDHPQFFSKVWHAVTTIPYGELRSYSQIAEMIGKPRAQRAVGLALAHNPIAIYIPCHRVIGKDGDLGHHRDKISQEMLELKRRLLILEGSIISPIKD
ncbi:MAG: methylated-DNA--[protein]-cysteine S-methyltransferase [Bacillota bacterium]|jgi:O-6-methylguanine DNA methyltransferase